MSCESTKVGLEVCVKTLQLFLPKNSYYQAILAIMP